MTFILPFSVWDCPWLPLVALFMDLLWGDPSLPWQHPVCYLGKCLNWLEPHLRQFASHKAKNQARFEKFGGFIALGLVAGGAFSLVLFLIQLPWLGVIWAIYLAWAGLAFGCLDQTGRIVLERVESGDLQKAREGVAWLVSRDISQLDQPMLRKTLADTLAENFTDAFLAPYFWLIIAGPAGLWFYKAVSTMDSQWGYLTPQWRNLGYAGAKGDDWLAWFPARLSPLALYSAFLLFVRINTAQHGQWPGYGQIRKDSKGMPSPNSGWSMAVLAWLCNGRMAGPSVYFGQLVHKEWLGPANAPPWNKDKLLLLLGLMRYGAIVGGLGIWLLSLLAYRLII